MCGPDQVSELFACMWGFDCPCFGASLNLKQRNMATNIQPQYKVRSTNFDWHEPVFTDTFEQAIEVAKNRGWDACVFLEGNLVATWSIIGGTQKYTRTPTPA